MFPLGGDDCKTAFTAAFKGGVAGDRNGELATKKTAGARGRGVNAFATIESVEVAGHASFAAVTADLSAGVVVNKNGDLESDLITGSNACGIGAGFTLDEDLIAGAAGAPGDFSPGC